MADISSVEWLNDCAHWRGVVLTGKYAHWCYDWDGLPVDETTPEWDGCSCFPNVEKSVDLGVSRETVAGNRD